MKIKSKTANILKQIETKNYERKANKEIIESNKLDARTIIMARYGMLLCGKNYKGTLKENCDQCNIIDNEDHRLNHCPKWDNNFSNKQEKTDFNNIFSTNIEKIKKIIGKVQTVWNVKNGSGSMN